MICFPNAKINLGLQVISARSDGYHNIESALFPIPFYDVLEFKPAKKYSIDVYGLSVPVPDGENLVSKAWKLMHDHFHIPSIAVKLLKSIPPGSGLGGGSADASFLLVALNNYFDLGLDVAKLAELSARLGSDCPFFVENKPVIVQGIGEKMSPIPDLLSGMTLLLVIPDIAIQTWEAFSNTTPHPGENPIRHTIEGPAGNWKTELSNDFEKYAFRKYPTLLQVKEQMYKKGAIYSSLSGSGSAIYGLFDEHPKELLFGGKMTERIMVL